MGKKKENSGTRIVSLTEARAKRVAKERRDFERFFLGEMTQVFCVTETGDLFPIEIVELSQAGCSFRVPFESADKVNLDNTGRFVQLRFYMSRDTYLPVAVKVTNTNPMLEQGFKYVRFGCGVEKELSSYQAYRQLVLFMDAFAKASRRESRKAAV
ncbi:MAG: PilZ domain-containing protein [Oligoflexia bacterium]|nr:PilZ domain-containing protein [Oligoflexia bacterium]